MPDNRFESLEGDKPLSPEMQKALARLSRFEHLEIGALKPAPSPAPAPQDKLLCLHCGQPNERERPTCWACFGPIGAKPKAAPKGPEDITLVLDGRTYHSSDCQLPQDIRELMESILREGYSPQLLANWQARRGLPAPGVHGAGVPPPSQTGRGLPAQTPARASEPETRGEDPLRDIKVFRGQRVSVIRVDGHVYTSDDSGLSEEMRELFRYIEENGVTPALMEHLRRFGKDVLFRPATTGDPTAEDLAFWREVSSHPRGPTRDLRARFLLAALALGGLFLYVVLSLLR